MHGIGMTPKRYRAGGKGETLTFACRDTVLGQIMMAATDRGVCFAQFGTDCKSLQSQLRSEFPQAELQAFEGQAGLQLDQWIDPLNAYIQNKRPRLKWCGYSARVVPKSFSRFA